MTAPTEAEIREGIRRVLVENRHHMELGPWVSWLGRPISYNPPDEDGNVEGDCLWDDLRPSEAARLQELVEAIYTEGDKWEAEIIERITDAVVAAGLTFAAEFPDARRAQKLTAVPA